METTDATIPAPKRVAMLGEEEKEDNVAPVDVETTDATVMAPERDVTSEK